MPPLLTRKPIRGFFSVPHPPKKLNVSCTSLPLLGRWQDWVAEPSKHASVLPRAALPALRDPDRSPATRPQQQGCKKRCKPPCWKQKSKSRSAAGHRSIPSMRFTKIVPRLACLQLASCVRAGSSSGPLYHQTDLRYVQTYSTAAPKPLPTEVPQFNGKSIFLARF